MMPTAQNNNNLIIGDENVNHTYLNGNTCNETNNNNNYVQINNLQPNLQTSNELNEKKNFKELNSQNSQRLLNDLTNNNVIVDCLAQNSLSRDANGKEQLSSISKDALNKDSNDLAASNDLSNRDSQLSNNSSNFSNQSSLTSSLFNSSINNNHVIVPDQRNKHKKYVNNKNRDSSSCDNSDSNLNNTNLVVTNNLANQLSKDDQPIKWKYSRSHQKRFKRRFPTIDQDEQLIDCKF